MKKILTAMTFLFGVSAMAHAAEAVDATTSQEPSTALTAMDPATDSVAPAPEAAPSPDQVPAAEAAPTPEQAPAADSAPSTDDKGTSAGDSDEDDDDEDEDGECS